MSVPYYRADRAFIGFLSEKKAEQYATDGTAWAVRSKNGMIRRVYRKAFEKIHPLDFFATTTERLRGEDGNFIGGRGPWARQHKVMRGI